MSIFDKVGPLGESKLPNPQNVFKNMQNAQGQLDDLAQRGTSLLKSIFGFGGGGESLNYPLDIEGNPAYAATVSFQVHEFRSSNPGKSQKSHLKQQDDNLKQKLKEEDDARNAAAGLGQVDDFGSMNPGFQMSNDANSQFLGATNQPISFVDDASAAPNRFVGGDDAAALNFMAKRDSVAENNEIKKVANTATTMDFFPKSGSPTVKMFFPASQVFLDGVQYQSLGIGAGGAAAEQAIAQGQSGVGAFAQQFVDDVKGAATALLNKDIDVGPMGPELARFAATRATNRFRSSALPAVSNITKMTVNPNIRTLFNGVNVREFTFQFKLIATSPQEARNVQDIIKFFRTELYPKAFDVPIGSLNIEAKLGFNFPNAFKIRFNFKGVENANLPKLKECYLRSISHTVNPTGGGFKVDGKPNEVDLTLQFVENQTLDQDDIKAGF